MMVPMGMDNKTGVINEIPMMPHPVHILTKRRFFGVKTFFRFSFATLMEYEVLILPFLSVIVEVCNISLLKVLK